MKVLVVTFPNDLGSRTIEKNLCDLLRPDLDLKVFRFAAHDAAKIDHRLDNRRNVLRRFQDARALRRAVREAVREGRRVLFYNVSPAMFAYHSWRGGKAYITMDWAWKLFTPQPRGLRALIAWYHRRIFLSCSGLLPMTEAMARCLIRDYQVPATLVRRVPSLFDVAHFDPGEITTSDTIRVLFVGGDVRRKGGDLLYDAYRGRLQGRCTLTMVTQTDFAACPGFTLRKGVRYGTPEHLELMRAHDLFVLPTREDAGPQVIGEAAAAGLAVVTTRSALGAPHVVEDGVNGIIAENPAACIDALDDLLNDPARIHHMRRASLRHMRGNFSQNRISTAYQNGMND